MADYVRLLNGSGEEIGTAESPVYTADYQAVVVACTPAITAGAYSANDNIGGTLVFPAAARAAGKGISIETITVSDLAKQNAALDIVFFRGGVTAVADNAAADVADADLPTALGHVNLAAASYLSLADNSVVCARAVGIAGTINSTTLYAILSTTGTPTYASTADLTVILGIRQY